MSEPNAMSGKKRESQGSLPGAESPQDELQLQVLQQGEQIKSLEGMLAKVSHQLEQMGHRHVSASPDALSDFDVLSRSQAVAKRMERESEERSVRRRMPVDELQDGQEKFEVSMDREPCMTRIVGGSGPNTAREKYYKYFGIIGNDPGKKIHVSDPVDSKDVADKMKAQLEAVS